MSVCVLERGYYQASLISQGQALRPCCLSDSSLHWVGVLEAPGQVARWCVCVCVCVLGGCQRQAFFKCAGAFPPPSAEGGSGPAKAGRCLDQTCTPHIQHPPGWVMGERARHPRMEPPTPTLRCGWWMGGCSSSPRVVTSSRCSPIMFIGRAFIFRWHTPVSSQTGPERPSIHRALGGHCTAGSALHT